MQVNLFQLLCLAASRFAVLVAMLPFVNRDVRYFHRSICEIIGKTEKGINLCVLHAAASGLQSEHATRDGGRSSSLIVCASSSGAYAQRELRTSERPLPVLEKEEVRRRESMVLMSILSCSHTAACGCSTHQFWSIGVLSFQVVLEKRRERKLTGSAEEGDQWTALLASLSRDARRLQQRSAHDVSWLIHDPRNAFIMSE